MDYTLLKFKKNGQLYSESSDTYWGQGENNADALQVQFISSEEGVTPITYYNLSQYTVECVVERPDGIISPSLIMSTTTVDGIKTAQLNINNWITEVAGQIRMVIRLKQTVLGVTTLLTTGIYYRVIGEGIPPADTTITDAEKAALDASIAALDTRLDTAESDIDTIEATLPKKVDYFGDDGTTTMEDLYAIYGSKPFVAKSTDSQSIVIATLYTNNQNPTQYGYSAIVIVNNQNGNGVSNIYQRTYFIDIDKTISQFISNIKNSDNKLQSKKDLDTVLNGYVTKVTGKGLSENDFTSVLKATYDGYAALIAAKADTTTVNAALALKGDKANLDAVEAKIPSAATSSNQLADKNFVNSSINAMASFQLAYNASGDPFPTKAALEAATTFYNAGVVRTPTQNDYAVVADDETQDNAQVRYNFQGTWEETYSWQFGYKINDKPFTAAQNNAINSGITASKVSQYDGYASSKLDKVGRGETNRIYGVLEAGSQYMYSISNERAGYTVPLRKANGELQVGTPIDTYDATNKQYVDQRVFTPTLTQLTDGSYSMDI